MDGSNQLVPHPDNFKSLTWHCPLFVTLLFQINNIQYLETQIPRFLDHTHSSIIIKKKIIPDRELAQTHLQALRQLLTDLCSPPSFLPFSNPPPSLQNGFQALLFLSAILLHTSTSYTGCSYRLNKKTTWFITELHEFLLDFTMDSEKRIGWVFQISFLAKSCKFGVLFLIRLAIKLSPCSAGSKREILHTSAVDLDARVEDTNPQGGGVFVYPVLQ